MALATRLYKKGKSIFHAAIDGFMDSRLTKKFATKYPKAFQIFLDRFSLNEFTGLPLTFLIVSFTANLFLLNEIVETVETSTLMTSIDRAFAHLMFTIRMNGVVQAFYYFSLLGSFWGVVIMAVISISIFMIKKRSAYILPVLISLLGSDWTMQFAKKYYHRIRPEEFGYYHEVDYSFPSGHATISVAFYGALFYAIIRTHRKYSDKFRWMITAILFIGLLGFSRLYLCVHYLSDVLAGYSLGLLWLLLAISMNEWNMHRKKNPRRDALNATNKIH